MRVMISQPRYLPCLHYLRRIHNVDLFVIMDEVQRTVRGYENRNKIIVNGQPKWLTIPVIGSKRAKINEAGIQEGWRTDHYNVVHENYHKLENYDEDLVTWLYKHFYAKENYKDVLVRHLQKCLHMIEIDTEVVMQSEIAPKRKGINLLADICEYLDATTYVTGATAKEYGLTENSFESIGCKIEFDYNKPIVYNQANTDEFKEYIGFIDAMFNIGLTETEKLIKT